MCGCMVLCAACSTGSLVLVVGLGFTVWVWDGVSVCLRRFAFGGSEVEGG